MGRDIVMSKEIMECFCAGCLGDVQWIVGILRQA